MNVNLNTNCQTNCPCTAVKNKQSNTSFKQKNIAKSIHRAEKIVKVADNVYKIGWMGFVAGFLLGAVTLISDKIKENMHPNVPIHIMTTGVMAGLGSTVIKDEYKQKIADLKEEQKKSN